MDRDPRNEFRASHLKISEEIEEKGPWSRVVGDGTEVLGGTGRYWEEGRGSQPSSHEEEGGAAKQDGALQPGSGEMLRWLC